MLPSSLLVGGFGWLGARVRLASRDPQQCCSLGMHQRLTPSQTLSNWTFSIDVAETRRPHSAQQRQSLRGGLSSVPANNPDETEICVLLKLAAAPDGWLSDKPAKLRCEIDGGTSQ